MIVTKWVDMGAEVSVQIGVDDIRGALCEAFSATNQELEQAVNVHDILRAFNNIASFLRAFTDEQIAALNPKQREIIGNFLRESAQRFGEKEFYFLFPDSTDVCGPYQTMEQLQKDTAWNDPRWKPIWRYKAAGAGAWNDVVRPDA